VRAFRSFDRVAIVADQRTLQWPRVRKVARLQVSLVRKPLVDVGRSVELPDESLIRVVLLAPGSEPAERPDGDCERESQEQQSGREPQSSARGAPYRLPPPCPSPRLPGLACEGPARASDIPLLWPGGKPWSRPRAFPCPRPRAPTPARNAAALVCPSALAFPHGGPEDCCETSAGAAGTWIETMGRTGADGLGRTAGCARRARLGTTAVRGGAAGLAGTTAGDAVRSVALGARPAGVSNGAATTSPAPPITGASGSGVRCAPGRTNTASQIDVAAARAARVVCEK
jgi:hypothetical protein